MSPDPDNLPTWGPDAGPPVLPIELDVLGRRLEAAAARRLRVRRRWRVALETAFVLIVGPPLALSTSAVDVSPASGAVAPLARAQGVWPRAPSLLPEPPSAQTFAARRACSRDGDCQKPAPSPTTPFPLRKYE